LAQRATATNGLGQVFDDEVDECTTSSHGTCQMMLMQTSQTSQKVAEEEGKTGTASTFRLFCFAWTPRRPNDEILMSAARKELERCDGHFFFTDVDAPGSDTDGDWMRVQLPPSLESRSASDWLNHRNMIGVAPVWERIFQMDLASQYDWIIHVELDHFVMVDRVRNMVLQYLETLQSDVLEQNRAGHFKDGSLLLCWGNAFLFNSDLVREMAANWNALGAPIQENIKGKGCPHISFNRVREEGKCEQDMAYPQLADFLHIRKYGAEGCNQPSGLESGTSLPLACWQGPVEWEHETKVRVIRAIAALRGANSMDEAQPLCDSLGVANMCSSLFDAAHVPLMHNFKLPEQHELAQQLLLQ